LELSWTTFFFEILNFLVLVWILKTFLYKPVLRVLENRKKTIDGSLAEAQNLKQQASELEQTFHSRLDNWAQEKQQLYDQLQQEIQTERAQKIELLDKEIQEKREQATIIEQRLQAKKTESELQKAHEQGARFASRLLSSVASPELENQLFNVLLNKLDRLPDDTLNALISACGSIDQITITSVYPLTEQQQQLIANKLTSLCDKTIGVNFEQDPELLSGLRICIGAWVLRFNLQDELISYSELGHDNPIR